MSRTYRKYVKCGVCTGSNTEYYRDMNRKVRRKNNHSLRSLTFLISRKDFNTYKYELDGSITKNKHYGTGENYWKHKFGKYLKPKNRKHYKMV